jgi:hypothetical protein
MKFGGIPADRLRRGIPWTNMSLMKMPIAPLIPPTQGPYNTAKIAGTTTAGKNPIPKKLKFAVKIPNAA